MGELFKLEQVTDKLTRIIGSTGENMYLAVGNERALLIDTGVGLGSLKAVVTELTDKPITVVITHGHVDHAFGAAEFDDVYMSSKDNDIFQLHSDMGTRMGYCQMSPLDWVRSAGPESYLPAATGFKELNDGDVFELGGLTIEIYAFPGHTIGSMTVLFKEERLLLTGDAANLATFMFFSGSPSIEAYRETILEYKARMEGKYDKILLSHGSDVLEPELLDVLVETCDAIMTGTDNGIRMDFMGEEAYAAFEMAFHPETGFGRVDGKRGNIVYSKKNIFRQ